MTVYHLFENLVRLGKHREVVNLLNEIMERKSLSVFEKGWAYWNISDRYALMRESESEYKNHLEFVAWGKQTLFPDKLHWFVSDATQALSLSLCNKLDDWIDWYEYACQNSIKNRENRTVRFESHRALAYTLLKTDNLLNVKIPLQRMKELLQEDENWENIIFSRITYYSILLELGYRLNENDIAEEAKANIMLMLENDMTELEKYQEQKMHLLGSWEQLNASRQSTKAMLVIFNNLGCTFAKTLDYIESVKVFNAAVNRGHKLNRYGLAMYLLSNWELNKNRVEIDYLFNKLGENHYRFNELLDLAPALQEAVR